MATIHDIARKTGVSPNTVSRILSGRSARPYNEAKVLAAARQLGYVRNGQASSLRSGRSHLLGLLIPDIRNPHYTELYQLLQDRAHERGYQILLFSSGGRMRHEMRALKLMEQSCVDGVILNASEGEPDHECDAMLRRLIQRSIPVLIDGRPLRDLPADQIVIRNEIGIRKAVTYLKSIGRRRIAFLCGSRSSLAGKERHNAYRKALKELELPVRPYRESFGEYTLESGLKQTARLLQQRSRPDAIVACNDLLAIGAIRAVHSRGLQVPEDVAVTGFDDIPLASAVAPDLSTLRLPREQMARESLDLLIRRLGADAGAPPQKLVYVPDLILRQSA